MRKYLIVLLLASMALCSCRSGIKVISYNVGTFTKSGQDCTQMIADMLSERQPDFVGLCELDSCTVRTGGRYQLAELSSKVKGGYQAVFASALDFQGGKYGIGMLIKDKYPVICTDVINLEKADGAEQRVLCIAQTPDIIFAVTHIDHIGEQARALQCVQITFTLMKLAKETGKVVVLCGDFNSTPESKEVEFLREFWDQVSLSEATYPSDSPTKCIDYIFTLKGSGVTCLNSGVVESTETFDAARASDHLAVFAELD